MQSRMRFVGPAYFFDNKSLSYQESINYYLEIMGEEGRETMALRGTPGLVSWNSTLSGSVRGMETFFGIPYAVVGTTFYKFDSAGNATSLGAISGVWRAYLNYNNGNQVIISNQPVAYIDGYFVFPGNVAIAYIYDISAGTLVQITDADFSSSDDGTFFISAIDDGTSYDALDFASPESSPDGVLAIVADHRQIIIFGSVTTEFWINTGNVDFPFERQRGAILQRGIEAPGAVVQADNRVIFLGHDRVVYSLEGYSDTPLSPTPVTEAIENYGDVSDAEAFYHVYRGHKFYTLNFPSAGETWVCDLTLPPAMAWHKRRSWGKTRWRARSYCRAYNKHLIGDYESGTIWYMDGSVYKEGTDPLEAIRTGHFLHADHRQVTVKSFELVMKTGIGLISGQGENPLIGLSWSKDNGESFTSERWKPMGRMGAATTRVLWRNGPTSKLALIPRVRITDPVQRDIVGAVGNVKVGR